MFLLAGSTVNVCALDLSKAFDKMNHYGLFVKLMERQIPENLLLLLERWFSICISCVKWCNAWSSWFTLRCGIRQGGVLSPCLFAIYIDGLVKKVQSCGYGCYVRHTCVSILLYADDILLLAPSVSALQLLLSVCEKELQWLDMSINAKKSACLRIGPRYNAKCKCIMTSNGGEISWVNTLRYLGVHICAAHKFLCSICDAKKSFYRSFNCIFGKIGRIASENVIVELLKSKCLSSLFYGLEACPLNKSQISSLEYAIHCVFRKIFVTKSPTVVNDCLLFFNCSVADAIYRRKTKFLSKLQHTDNTLLAMFCSNMAAEIAKLPL